MRRKLRYLNKLWYRLSIFVSTIWLANIVKNYIQARWLSVEGVLIGLVFLGLYLFEDELIDEVLFKEKEKDEAKN